MHMNPKQIELNKRHNQARHYVSKRTNILKKNEKEREKNYCMIEMNEESRFRSA